MNNNGIKGKVLERIKKNNKIDENDGNTLIKTRDVNLTSDTKVQIFTFKNINNHNINVCDLTSVSFDDEDISYDVLSEFDDEETVIYVLENGNSIPNMRRIIGSSSIKQQFVTNDEEEYVNIYYEYPEENYLEYKKDKYNCTLYNISLGQMMKLFEKVGLRIFDYNVRYYIERKDKKSYSLYYAFMEYLYDFIFNNHRLLLDNENVKKFFSKLFGDKKPDSISSKFWVCHNGIAVCTDNVKTNVNELIFEIDKTYILNGCQSIMTFVDIFQDFKKCDLDLKEKIQSIIEDFSKSIIFKVTIINESKIESIKHYSYCLNSQRPIEKEDILASSDEADEIRNSLRYVKILKPGEKNTYKGQIGVNLKEFIKLYYNYDKKPGTSKNFNVEKDLSSSFKKIYSIIIKEEESASDKKERLEKLSSDLRKCYNAQKCYSKVKEKTRDEKLVDDTIINSSNYKINNDCIDSYGSNYFSSYCSLYNIDDSDEAFIEAFKTFKKDILKYCYDQNELLDFQTFKDMEAEDTSKSKTLFDRVFKNKKEEN